MSFKAIKIVNLLSFDNVRITDMSTITCFIGRNNAGKSNLLKLIKFFYESLEGKRLLSPELNSNYNASGFIEIEFDTSHINKLVHSDRNRSNRYFTEIYNSLFRNSNRGFLSFITRPRKEVNNTFKIKLNVKSDGAISWSNNNKKVHKVLLDLFPLFEIDVRKLELHNWDDIWQYLGKLRPFNVNVFQSELKEFIEGNENKHIEKYKVAVKEINNLSETAVYNYRDKIINYLKMGLKGHTFENKGVALNQTSDGTNSYNYLVTSLRLVALLSRNLYISPIVLVDEPELGLHPKKIEHLVSTLNSILTLNYSNDSGEFVKTSMPSFFFSTHSPNFVKQVILKFQNLHSIQYVSLNSKLKTQVEPMNSNYNDNKFLAVFSDNEARLFFSSFILFVEGATELHLFSNDMLSRKFPFLLDVDIYQTSNNIISEGINPSASNTSIPYLFLFDADKAFDFEYEGNCTINLKKTSAMLNLKPINLKNKLKFYSRGFSRDFREKKRIVQKLIELDGHDICHSKTKFVPKKPHSFKSLFHGINRILADNNVYVLPTTFEGALINVSSSSLFFNWLRSEGHKGIDIVLDEIAKRRMFSVDMLIQYLRIIFNGKTDSLVQKKNINGKTHRGYEYMCSGNSKKLYKKLDRVLKIPDSKTSKATSWGSDYLTYAILEIEKEVKIKEDKTFDELFHIYFPDLSVILSKLQIGSSRGS